MAGIISVTLTVLGLAISILSEDLQRRDAQEAQKAETKRTNDIIIAGQQLTSLKFTVKFADIGDAFLAQINSNQAAANKFEMDAQRERAASENNAADRERVLYPFLLKLARDLARDEVQPNDSDVVLLLSLDDSRNAVLPVGFFANEKPWLNETKDKANPLSLEIGSHDQLGNADLPNWPSLSIEDKNVVTVAWRLDPTTFSRSLNRQYQDINPTAKLPDALRIAVLFDIKTLPFERGNFALAEYPDFWDFPDYEDGQNRNFRGELLPLTDHFSSTVDLVPNSSPIVAYHYDLKRIYETLFLDDFGEANRDVRCVVFEFRISN